jgi:NAD-dependent oxidoreductase involved in siderophore biosynthesis
MGVAVVGSSDFIAGEMESVEFAELYAKDSKKARELSRLVGLSLFLTPERDTIAVRNAFILKVDKLSKGVNGMVDGAISLRPSL